MTTSKPDVQALIEGLASIRSSQADSGWMIEEDLEIIAQAEEALSALSGETETVWEYGVLGTFQEDGEYWDDWVEPSHELAVITVSTLKETEESGEELPAVSWAVVRRKRRVEIPNREWEVVV